MPSLSDRIDHLATTAKAIRATAAAVVPSEDNPAPRAIPFTRAVLDTSLGDLIRDVDASELGLFTIIAAPDVDVRKQSSYAPRRGEISRVAFPGATPLKRQPTRRDDMFKPKEYEPDVYARAALKYLDRYQSIRPMPRARSQVIAMIEQLDDTRENIKKLNETLQELTSAGITFSSSTMTTGVAEEEHRITDLQNRLAELRSQKDAILRLKEPKPASKPKVASKPIPKPSRTPSPEPEPESHEDAFWTTPVTSGRTLRFADRLLADEPDFAELSAISVSPGPAPPKSVLARLATGNVTTGKSSGTLTEDNVFRMPSENEDVDDLHDKSGLDETEPNPKTWALNSPGVETEDLEESPEEEKTIILKKVIKETPDSPLLSSSVNIQPRPPALAETQLYSDSPPKVVEVRITPELESIVARIWSTVGDILRPGRGGEKPPRAQETLDIIESLVASSSSPNSPTPSISSFASATNGPTPHQMNTAQLLHTLLAAPNHAVPLNQLKVAIGSTRALYACVAKKLIKIDRGGGEQIVLFDVGM